MPYPFSIASTEIEQFTFVSDARNHKILKFLTDSTHSMSFVADFGSFGSNDGEFNHPAGIALNPSGTELFVVDTNNYRVQVFDLDGNFLRKFGSLGSTNGQFLRPVGIAISKSGVVVVSDSSAHTLNKFTLQGQFVTKWGSFGPESGQFNSPSALEFAKDGTLWVSDSLNNRVVLYHRLNMRVVLRTIGHIGSDDEEFAYPTGISFSPDGEIALVVDTYNNRIQFFNRFGHFIRTWAAAGTELGELLNPFDARMTPSGRLLVANTLNNRFEYYNM